MLGGTMGRDELRQMLERLRRERPLVHNITNYVVMNFTANTLLAMGASPVMAHALDEVEEMVSLARALVLNIGTLSGEWIEAMLRAGKRANALGIPVVLDPVGSGATRLRTEASRRLCKELSLSVVRGNPSEILSFEDVASRTQGVDTAHAVDQASRAAQTLARRTGSVVAVTGEVDMITDGDRRILCRNGHPLLGRVTGTGCAATAAIAAFAGISDEPIQAAAAGLAFFGLGGEIAASRTKSTGSFMISLIDALYEIGPEDLQERARLEDGSFDGQ